MILAIDIGNSTATFGLYSDSRLITKFSIPSLRSQTSEDIFASIPPQIEADVSGVVISNVVAELEIPYRQLAKNYFHITPFFIDDSVDFGFAINYDPPESCGADRLVAVYGALERCEPPLLVCDFGTATTIDAVNSKREYLGGIITPGLNTLASALFEKTSKLPLVEIIRPEIVIANTTVGSIQSGIYNGYIGLVDGLIEKMFNELGETAEIVATGGLAPLISEGSKYVSESDPDLLLNGLFQLYMRSLNE